MIALIGFLPIAFGVFCGWVLWKTFQLPAEDRSSEAMWELGAGSALGILLGLLMIYFGFKLALKADMTEPYSREKPTTRF